MRGSWTTGLVSVALAASFLSPGVARAGGDPLGFLAHPPAAASAAVSQPQVVTPQLAKFQASGRVTIAFSVGPCASGPEQSCSSGCEQLQVTGPVTLSPGGKGNVSACITVDESNVTNPLCFGDEQGNGTITLQNGDTITFAMGGHFCLADLTPVASPTSEIVMSTGGYAINGGTGKQASAVGTGQYSVPLTATISSTTSTSPFTLVGNYAKQ